MATPASGGASAVPPRRRYESPLRQEQAAQTRARIVSAGTALARRTRTWSWDELTFRAVAAQAGVGERTVYRHFPTERHLHEAVMRQLEVEAGVAYEDLTQDNLVEMTARVFRAALTFGVGTEDMPVDPAVAAAGERRRDALRRVVGNSAPSAPLEERERAAALLDVLWSPPVFERLVQEWGLDGDEATSVLSWLITRVMDDIGQGRLPPAGGLAPST